MPSSQARSSSVRQDPEVPNRTTPSPLDGPRHGAGGGSPRAAERAPADEALEPHWLSAIDAATD